jgi:hypothetical protein
MILSGRVGVLLVALLGILFGLAYGVFARFVFDIKPSGNEHPVVVSAFAAMSVCFLFLVPLAMGALTALFSPRDSRWRWLYWWLLPLVPCLLLMGVVLALAWEGMICIVMASPIFLGMSMAGGLGTGVILWLVERQRIQRPAPVGTVASALVLPFLLAPVEARVPPADALREVATSTYIAADAPTVWRQIVRVPVITQAEQPRSFFHAIGIPRPNEATLSQEGIGGVRRARFEGGIVFDETVTEWTPGESFAFRIRVDPGSIGPSVLDRHVTVGGEYFDVLQGRFRIEPAGGGVVLHLTSQHRLTTRFNGYAGLWTDAIMRDIQATVCAVVKQRSEAGTPRP